MWFALLLAFSLVCNASAAAAAETSLEIYLGPGGGKSIRWEASVIGVANCYTTLALGCTQGAVCKNPQEATITYGRGIYALETKIRGTGGGVEKVFETCSLSGTTEAACTQTIRRVSGSNKAHTVFSTTFNKLNFEQVPVTKGAALLSAGSTCSTSGSAAPSGSASSGAGGGSGSSSSTGTLPAASSTGQTGAGGTTATSPGAAAAPTRLSEVYKVLVVQGAAALLAGALV